MTEQAFDKYHYQINEWPFERPFVYGALLCHFFVFIIFKSLLWGFLTSHNKLCEVYRVTLKFENHEIRSTEKNVS